MFSVLTAQCSAPMGLLGIQGKMGPVIGGFSTLGHIIISVFAGCSKSLHRGLQRGGGSEFPIWLLLICPWLLPTSPDFSGLLWPPLLLDYWLPRTLLESHWLLLHSIDPTDFPELLSTPLVLPPLWLPLTIWLPQTIPDSFWLCRTHLTPFTTPDSSWLCWTHLTPFTTCNSFWLILVLLNPRVPLTSFDSHWFQWLPLILFSSPCHPTSLTFRLLLTLSDSPDSQWLFVTPYVSPWIPMSLPDSLCLFLNPYVSPWLPMSLPDSLCLSLTSTPHLFWGMWNN